MAYVTRVPGTVIAAASQNSEYRDQVVSVFATTAARDAAITVPVRGMMCYCTVPGRMFVRGAAGWYEVGVADAPAQVRRYLARRVATQAVTNTLNTSTTISWDTEDVDSDAMAVPPWTSLTLSDGVWVFSGFAELIATITAAPAGLPVFPRLDTVVSGIASQVGLSTFSGAFGPVVGANVMRASISGVAAVAAGATVSVSVIIGTAWTNTTSITVTGGFQAVKVA